MLACLLPISENAKMYTVGLTAYFAMDCFKNSTLPIITFCVEYTMVSLLGSSCALLAYTLPLPGIQDPRAMKSAAAAFSDVADGCAEVITEATVAFLGTGAGDAWRAIAQQRLRELWERLAEAKATAEYWPLAAAQMLHPTGNSVEPGHSFLHLSCNFAVPGEELLLLKQFQSRSDASKLERGETFASARSEMASFLFLVHGLAADLLKREGSITQRAETLQEISMMPRASRARSLSAELTEDFLTSSLWVESKALQEPLLSPEQQRWRKNWGYRERTYQAVSSAVRLRWRSALKVSLSYFLALILDLHYGLDSVLVCTVSYLSSYGSQYAGGSLRRAISRGVGVAAGAT
ncbi:unnamed protein product, partial [Symbiodinium necroappetens]